MENWTSTPFSKGETGLAYYDTAECKYWVIKQTITKPGPSGSGLEGAFGVACTTTEATNCGGYTSTPSWPGVEYIEFGKNIFVDDTQYAGLTGIIISAAGAGEGGTQEFGFNGCSTEDCVEIPCLKFGVGFHFDGTDTVSGPTAGGGTSCTSGPNGGGTTEPQKAFCSLNFQGLKVTHDANNITSIIGPKISALNCQGGPVDGLTDEQFSRLEFGGGLEVQPQQIAGECTYRITGPKISAEKCDGGPLNGITDDNFSHLIFKGFQVTKVAGSCKFNIEGPKIANQDCNDESPTAFQAFNKLVIGKGIQYTYGTTDEVPPGPGADNCTVTISGPTIASEDACEKSADSNAIEATPFDSLKIDNGLKLVRNIEGSCDFTLSGPEIGKYHDACDPGTAGASDPLGRLFIGGGLKLASPDASDVRYKLCDWVITGPQVKGKSTICRGSTEGPTHFSTLTFGKGLSISPSQDASAENEHCKAYDVNGWTLTAGR